MRLPQLRIFTLAIGRKLVDTQAVNVRSSLTARVLLFLACALLIMARVSGTHFHLCFDGNEPRSSLHLVDDGEADLHFGANSPHEDLDVSLVGNLVVKQDTNEGDLLPILVAAAILLGLIRLASTRVPCLRPGILVPTPVFELRPPPRGPPA